MNTEEFLKEKLNQRSINQAKELASFALAIPKIVAITAEVESLLETCAIFNFPHSELNVYISSRIEVNFHGERTCKDFLPVLELFERAGFEFHSSSDYASIFNRDFHGEKDSVRVVLGLYMSSKNCQKVEIPRSSSYLSPDYALICGDKPEQQPAPSEEDSHDL